MMKARVETMPDQFVVAVDRGSGRIAGFVDGLAEDREHLRDEIFTDVTLHDPAAKTSFIMGLNVLPQYRGQGLARELVRLYCLWEQAKGRRRVVLTCLEGKIGMYRKMGFADLGASQSEWGGDSWHEMDRVLECGWDWVRPGCRWLCLS